MAELNHKEASFDGAGGVRIFYQRWIPEACDRVMVIAHGLGEHSGRYGNVVEYFTPRGFAVYALDHRGHGRSGGKKGHIGSFDEYLDDLDRLVRIAASDEEGKPLFLVGHSLGGLIALSYALTRPERLDGLIVSSSALKLAVDVPAWKAVLGKFFSRFIPTFTMGNELNPDDVSRDAAVVAAYKADPLVHDRVSARFFQEFVGAMERAHRDAHKLALPSLVLQAGADRLVDPDGSRAFYAKITHKDKALKVYEGLYHEIYNEAERGEVFADMEQWLEGRGRKEIGV